ncbi:sulfite exporter TauE/SafE family protein [Nesterenkonia halobia]|uniref:Probable membrane transporter protein n=1 Tax=Nesterenkonia halobia TaxID=37922 RepID=A0ABP6RKP9_9MICC
MELLGLGLDQILIIALAAIWAGAINVVVGSGTLVTFPVLVAVGFPPVTATISNAMGLIAGNVTGTLGYRREIAQVRTTLLRLVPASLVGGVVGALLLLTLPEQVFETVAPLLIVVALGFVLGQPRLKKWVASRAARARDEQPAGRPVDPDPRPSAALTALVFGAGVYGGYFVAAQGVLLVGILGVFLAGTMQHANAVKNALVLTVNLTAAASYLLLAFDRIAWPVVLIVAVGSTIGGFAGAWVGRRLSPGVLRGVIVVLGLVALGVMVRDLVVG